MRSRCLFVLKIKSKRAFSSFVPHEISVLIELTVGHLRYHLTDVPAQLNSPPDNVLRTDQAAEESTWNQKPVALQVSLVAPQNIMNVKDQELVSISHILFDM